MAVCHFDSCCKCLPNGLNNGLLCWCTLVSTCVTALSLVFQSQRLELKPVLNGCDHCASLQHWCCLLWCEKSVAAGIWSVQVIANCHRNLMCAVMWLRVLPCLAGLSPATSGSSASTESVSQFGGIVQSTTCTADPSVLNILQATWFAAFDQAVSEKWVSWCAAVEMDCKLRWQLCRMPVTIFKRRT